MQFPEIHFRFCFVHLAFLASLPHSLHGGITCLLLKAQIMGSVNVLVETLSQQCLMIIGNYSENLPAKFLLD